MASHLHNIFSFWLAVLLPVVSFAILLHPSPASPKSLETQDSRDFQKPRGSCPPVALDTCEMFCQVVVGYFDKPACFIWRKGTQFPKAFNCFCEPEEDGRQGMDMQPAMGNLIIPKAEEQAVVKSGNKIDGQTQVNCTEPYLQKCSSFCQPLFSLKACVFNFEEEYADWHQCICGPK